VPPPPDVAAEKNALRVAARARLAQLGPEERRARSEKLLARLMELATWQAARRVAVFAPLPTEPDLDLLWANDGLHGKECAYPRIAGAEMCLWRVRGPEDLQPGRWGLREPALTATAPMALAEFDLVLVPGLAFDGFGARLGRGGGFYDRLLAEKPATTIALGMAFAFQIVPAIPLAQHDAKMDVVLTD
jgi:5-formyltetrahydrofolate cyclo-ligase